MYGVFTYIWLMFIVNVGKYTSPMDAMSPIGTLNLCVVPPPCAVDAFPVFLGKVDIGKLPLLHSLLRACMAVGGG